MSFTPFYLRSQSQSKMKSSNRIINGQFSEPNQLSSSILLQTHEQHSFPKAKRFPSVTRENTPKLLLLADTKSKRATSFGFGIKSIKSIDLDKRDRLNPAPGDYEIKTLSNTKSFTFGNRLMRIHKQDVPGPGHYIIKQFTKTPKFSMYGKIIDKNIITKQSASFATYNPKEDLTINQRFNKISFGVGERSKQTINEEYPGPGSYYFKSLFQLIREKNKNQESI